MTQNIDDAIAEATEKSAKATPVKKMHDKGVFFSIFARTISRDDGTEVTLHNTAIERRFNDKNGEFQSSHSYSEEQLAVLADLAREARDYIREARANQKADQS